ncbi:pyrroloquinoline quinone precursor peptide PqqA [Solihabitans fulvus]|uniref:Coenzyme PQQ synthesis protein A n=1 Tax=Solihabitans fulvus TaxID=1892852 RepID=A0A5B2XHG3_9PSEU|nr:pyrroloquinoline quinone precursor peptide PqqA [Solihabitans fulvus]KAA2263247.1 pyrroloquinoline quinone precursor peptide PqqA [Solihabitans fulvus]
MSVTKNVSRQTAPAPASRGTARKTWVKPGFRDIDTPMEITAYAARTS